MLWLGLEITLFLLEHPPCVILGLTTRNIFRIFSAYISILWGDGVELNQNDQVGQYRRDNRSEGRLLHAEEAEGGEGLLQFNLVDQLTLGGKGNLVFVARP